MSHCVFSNADDFARFPSKFSSGTVALENTLCGFVGQASRNMQRT